MNFLSKFLSVALSAALLTTMIPVAAFANKMELNIDSDVDVIINKADYYLESEDDSESVSWAKSYEARAGSFTPINLSDEMKYFAKYESSQNYAQTLSSGDGYNAMGYYQFDRRYGLQDFITACYEFNPLTYAMFEPFANVNFIDLATVEVRKDGEFTEIGAALNTAWKMAYEANPTEFAGLQDAWAYQEYYLPAENYLAKRGIDISGRADCVKGLCWGLCNLFGSYGWRKFVGGVSDGYDWNGEWQEGIEWPGCGLDNSITDTEFVTRLCNYVVNNVSVFYKAQPQYHEGWENRYKKELNDCLSFLSSHWVADGDRWKYMLEDEYYANGWLKIGGCWYWFDAEGYAAQDCWKELSGKRYYFDSDRKMLANAWKNTPNGWYYLKSSGAMAYSEWERVGNHWYYFAEDGLMQTGWLEDAGKWYYLKASGAMAYSEWEEVNGYWYYFDASGAMQASKWVGDYYILASGKMACSEWEEIDRYWYYFDASGAKQISKWVGNYYVGSDGKMLTNQWVNQYYVGDDGKWIPDYAE